MSADSEPGNPVPRVEAHIESFSGPIPPPGMMRDYENVLPGSADRILTMAEREQLRQISYDNRGLNYAFVAAISLMALSALAIALGFAAASVGIIITGIAPVATSFKSSHPERQAE